MEKRTIYALLAVATLSLIAFLVLRSPEKGQRTGPGPRPFPESKAEQVTQLDVVSEKQDHTTLVKKGGGWRIQSAEDWGADPQAAKALIDAIAAVTLRADATHG